jgi:NADH-quinone oxidoreductase subunit E
MRALVVDDVLERHSYDPSAMVGILQDLQREFHWLPEPVLRAVAARLDVPLTRVYALASFYKALSLVPRGRHKVSICLGTACHVRGGVQIQEAIERHLKTRTGETTPDLRFTVEAVRCVGCCGLAPVVVIDENFHGKLDPVKATRVLEKYK